MHPDITLIDSVPGMDVLESALQRNLQFIINKKIIKTGKLILFKRVHYYIQMILQNNKNTTENYEIPIPFDVECYPENGLIYFDYRVDILAKRENDITKKLKEYRSHAVKSTSSFYDKILEIVVD